LLVSSDETWSGTNRNHHGSSACGRAIRLERGFHQ